MKLIPNWKHAWKMASVQIMALAAAIQATWASLPPDVITWVHPAVVHGVTTALLLLGIVGRILQQESIPDENKQ